MNKKTDIRKGEINSHKIHINGFNLFKMNIFQQRTNVCIFLFPKINKNSPYPELSTKRHHKEFNTRKNKNKIITQLCQMDQ